MLFFSGLSPELLNSELFAKYLHLNSQVEFRINGTALDIAKAGGSETEGKLSIVISDNEIIIQNPRQGIGVEVTLAKGIRPIRNAEGLDTRVSIHINQMKIISWKN